MATPKAKRSPIPSSNNLVGIVFFRCGTLCLTTIHLDAVGHHEESSFGGSSFVQPAGLQSLARPRCPRSRFVAKIAVDTSAFSPSSHWPPPPHCRRQSLRPPPSFSLWPAPTLVAANATRFSALRANKADFCRGHCRRSLRLPQPIVAATAVFLCGRRRRYHDQRCFALLYAAANFQPRRGHTALVGAHCHRPPSAIAICLRCGARGLPSRPQPPLVAATAFTVIPAHCRRLLLRGRHPTWRPTPSFTAVTVIPRGASPRSTPLHAATNATPYQPEQFSHPRL